jgi:hypothetical protein
MIQSAAREVGVEAPDTVISNTDENTVRLLAAAQTEGRRLGSRTRWPALRVEATFTSLAAELQGTLASIVSATYAFDHIIPDTFYNRTTGQKVTPLTSKDYQALKASVGGIAPRFYIRGASLYLYPTPAAGETNAFEFIDKSFCQATGGGARKTAWSADTDVGLLDEDLMMLGVMWRWKKANGLDYGEDFNTYEDAVVLAVGRVDPAETISLTPETPYGPFGIITVPDGNWNI